MKQKLLNALKEGYKQLGLSESAFERVATFGETFITSDEQIESFVKAAEAMLRPEQSEADKVRTELNAKIKGLEGVKAELEAKLNGNQSTDPTKQTEGESEISKLVRLMQEQSEQMRKQNEALTARLDAMEGAKASEVAVKTAQEQFFADEWVNGYPELRDAAWQQAIDVYEDTERKYTAEQLHEKAMKYFKPLAKAKGLDISKPFQSDGASGETKTGFSGLAERLRGKGLLPNENNN